MYHFEAYNVPRAYKYILERLKILGVEENSRNGPVLSFDKPVVLTIHNPLERVLSCPVRDANPFFHVLEFVWMMAGRNDADFVGALVKRMYEYAEPDGYFHGAYGHRWRHHFGFDQISKAISKLAVNPQDRRVVIGMWDPTVDLPTSMKDHPCNTQILPRIVNGKLDFMVTNRSNDIIWGMMGANAVHMTLLHQLMADAIKVGVGSYRVMSTNAHVYANLPKLEEMMDSKITDLYEDGYKPCTKILPATESYASFVAACEKFCNEPGPNSGSSWVDSVAYPMYNAYMCRGTPEKALSILQLQCRAEDWWVAGSEWITRHRMQR